MAVLGGTPLWVWALLAYVVWQGARAMRDRAVSPGSLLVMPAVFLALSARPMLETASRAAEFVPPWLAGLALGAALGWWIAARSPASARPGALLLPGTWTVLAASLLFFGIQYWLGAQRAVRPDALREWPLAAAAPFASALGAGFFAGRAGSLLRRYRRAVQPAT